MATYSKVLLSGLPQGIMTSVGVITSPGTLVHQTGISATVIDEVTLFATNFATTDLTVTLQFGGTTVFNESTVTVPPNTGLQLLCAGLPLTGTGAAVAEVRIYASQAFAINVCGWVNRYT